MFLCKELVLIVSDYQKLVTLFAQINNNTHEGIHCELKFTAGLCVCRTHR